MKILLFGASGMVGQGVLRECLADERVQSVMSVVRTKSTFVHSKLTECVVNDFSDYSGFDSLFTQVDACFFCLGVSSAGMSEEKYTTITYDYTLAACKKLSALSPEAVMVYVSGEGADSSEQGRTMWARVRGRTENNLLTLSLKVSIFRLGLIQPLFGVVSKTASSRIFYAVTKPLLPLLVRLFPRYATTTQKVAQAMLQLALSHQSVGLVFSDKVNQLAKEYIATL